MCAYEIAFHTPELPPKLNLDLVSLSGGGACPSQFYGETHDGQEVYVRYRGGHLRVDMADSALGNARNGARILELDIGPAFDGSMSLAQFCTFFGVTINGTLPPETNPRADHFTDFSGQTTYWQAFLPSVTIGTSRDILAATCADFPPALLVQPALDQNDRIEKLVSVTPEDADGYNVYLVEGTTSAADIDFKPEGDVLQKPAQLLIELGFGLWKHPQPYCSSMLLDRAAEQLGRTPIQAGIVGMPGGQGIAHSTFRLRAAFPTNNSEMRAQLADLGDVLKRCLPITHLERIDLKTGQSVSELHRPLDPRLRDWCWKGPDRWISLTRDGPNGPWLGVRPVRDQ